MRKSQFWGCLAILLSLAACSDETQPQQNESAAISVPDFAKETFSIGKAELEQPWMVPLESPTMPPKTFAHSCCRRFPLIL